MYDFDDYHHNCIPATVALWSDPRFESKRSQVQVLDSQLLFLYYYFFCCYALLIIKFINVLLGGLRLGAATPSFQYCTLKSLLFSMQQSQAGNRVRTVTLYVVLSGHFFFLA